MTHAIRIVPVVGKPETFPDTKAGLVHARTRAQEIADRTRSRVAMERVRWTKPQRAKRVREDDAGVADAFPPSRAEHPGEFNLHVMKTSPSRWGYSLVNPQGGSFSTSAFPTLKQAVAAGMRGVRGVDRVWTIQSEWDGDQYVVRKTSWTPVQAAAAVRESRLERLRGSRSKRRRS